VCGGGGWCKLPGPGDPQWGPRSDCSAHVSFAV